MRPSTKQGLENELWLKNAVATPLFFTNVYYAGKANVPSNYSLMCFHCMQGIVRDGIGNDIQRNYIWDLTQGNNV